VANEELQKIYDLFIKKYSNGEMTKDEFINENLRLNGGSEQFWEEMFHQFESKKTGRINVKGLPFHTAIRLLDTGFGIIN
jgi:Ca2+-binding EF-hand superfamily protein